MLLTVNQAKAAGVLTAAATNSCPATTPASYCSFTWCDVNINDQHEVQEVRSLHTVAGREQMGPYVACADAGSKAQTEKGRLYGALHTPCTVPRLHQVYELLHKNYVEDDDAMFRCIVALCCAVL
jgi:hypothetical protein